jgi:hypothetical protein
MRSQTTSHRLSIYQNPKISIKLAPPDVGVAANNGLPALAAAGSHPPLTCLPMGHVRYQGCGSAPLPLLASRPSAVARSSASTCTLQLPKLQGRALGKIRRPSAPHELKTVPASLCIYRPPALRAAHGARTRSLAIQAGPQDNYTASSASHSRTRDSYSNVRERRQNTYTEIRRHQTVHQYASVEGRRFTLNEMIEFGTVRLPCWHGHSGWH